MPEEATYNESEELEHTTVIDEEDVIETISLDEEDLPDVGEEDGDGEDDEGIVDDALQTFCAHTDALYAVASNPVDESCFASGGGDNTAFLWRLGHERPLFEMNGHADSVVSLSFSHDGRFLATGGLDGVVKIWDVSNGKLLHSLDGPGEGIEWVKWHPRGHVVLAGSEDSTVWMWNANLGLCMSVFTGHSKSVTCGNFTPDGKTICTGSEDGSLRIWNPQTQESKHIAKIDYSTFSNDEEEGITCLTISSDSAMVAAGSNLGSVPIVHIKTGKVLTTLVGHSGSVECVGISPSMSWIATGDMHGKLMIWEMQNFSLRCTCEHYEGVMRLSWCNSSQHIITACLGGIVRIWDSRQGSCERIFQGHHDSIQDMAITMNDRFAITGSDDKTLKIFQLRET